MNLKVRPKKVDMGKIKDPILKAYMFAQEKHKGQTRKFSGKPYFVHPNAVADLVDKYTKDPTLKVAAYLHDTLEDTKTTYQDLSVLFSKHIANLVKELTSVDSDLKKVGKAQYLTNKMNKMSKDALTIKLCDRLDNISGGMSRSFKEKYTKETEHIINNLKRPLTGVHKKIIKDIQKRLVILKKELGSRGATDSASGS